jgi:hypothetical protein
VRPGGIDADANDLGAQVTELLDTFSELGKLVRSTRAEVEWVGQQDDATAGERVRQTERLAPAYG